MVKITVNDFNNATCRKDHQKIHFVNTLLSVEDAHYFFIHLAGYEGIDPFDKETPFVAIGTIAEDGRMIIRQQQICY